MQDWTGETKVFFSDQRKNLEWIWLGEVKEVLNTIGKNSQNPSWEAEYSCQYQLLLISYVQWKEHRRWRSFKSWSFYWLFGRNLDICAIETLLDFQLERIQIYWGAFLRFFWPSPFTNQVVFEICIPHVLKKLSITPKHEIFWKMYSMVK